MLALIRYSVPGSQAGEFVDGARTILATLAAQTGFLGGHIGRSVDEPDLWALVSEWEGAGYYRRALSAARMDMYPLMTLMINEPSAFEIIASSPE
ncbi:antibiotic biosynthesis monooxygenase family protein [Sphaerisporangium sp. NPDC005288]|uniref:Antibiotic biosynthesis monooxygenase family protein n=1 Tax=Sphaerisporangium rhizosphaerae TaxID=2269375 RepID=A0ABW2P0T3_9ACTN